MKNTTHWMGFALAALVVATGCKTPQLAWWKSSKSAESTTLADAPVSPAEAAKQAEEIATSSTQLVGNEAPAYTPTTNAASTTASSVNGLPNLAASTPSPPASYPKTAAAAYTPESVAAAVSSTPAADPRGQRVAPIYNAQQPPQSPIVQQQPTVTPSSRYDQATPETGLPPAETLVGAPATPPAAPSGNDRYGAPSSPAPSPHLAGNAGSPTSTAPGTQDLGPYPGGNATTQAAPQTETPSGPLQVAATPYRPGGTSSYPGTVPMVANNPPASPTSRYAPSPTAGSEGADPADPSSSSRYW